LGELHQAYEYYQQALTGARRREDHDITANALLGLANISFEWNEFAATEQQTNEAMALAQEQDLDLRNRAAFQLALLSHARGQITSAEQQLAALLARLQVTPTFLARQMLSDVQVWLARLSLEIGNLPGALRSVETLNPEELAASIFQARLLLAQEKPHEARRRLEDLHSMAQENQQVRDMLQIQILLSLAYTASQQIQQARQTLRLALAQARTEGYVRLFIAEGEPLIRLLRQFVPTIQEKELRTYAQSLLRAFASVNGEQISTTTSTTPNSLPFESLSAQERRVLQLLAAGNTNMEIARELVVSVNTVKGHLKHVYSKLGVSTRLQASEVARRFNLV
jgi:LuxR family maltose regulon positive regulatory protein